MVSVSSGNPPAILKRNPDQTVEVVTHGALISKRLRGRGPGVPRREAATVLAMIAQTTAFGSWPKGITPRMLGRALRCALPNARQKASSELLFAEMMSGFIDAAGGTASPSRK